ncbi:MAG TPA: hypothetical protein VLY04_24390 [Bryobacteraceae bacterium]|nr:hypothetical protein [Bryobacteraceae bacterium]
MKRLVVLAPVLALFLAPLPAATLERLSLDDMITQSTAVVRGKVTGSYTAFSGPVIYTHYQIQVSETLKGSARPTVDLMVPGGIANHLRQSFAGAPQFKPGDEFVFFLWTGKSGNTQVIGLTQGLFALSADGTSDPVVTRSASREVMLQRGTGQQVKDETLVMHLSELRAQIAATLGTASKGASK